ncbi:MAG: HAD family phosphatase [Turicibacter sp.]|nr:HAD family phosphatase [Turicibacter sp.]
MKLVIFDMDGVLIDSEPPSKEAWRLALEHYGYKLDDAFFAKMVMGRNLAAIRAVMNEHYGDGSFDFDLILKRRADYMDKYINDGKLKIKYGLIEMLDRLNALNIKSCVATSTNRKNMTKRLSLLNIIDRFDGFVTGDEVTNSKPDPEIFLKAAKIMDVNPQDCIVIEDSPNGIAAAVAADIRVIMIPDTIAPTEELSKQVYAVCQNLIEAADLIAGL